MNRCIFLSYRRDDTAGYAGHLAGDLRARLEGDTQIVMDVDTFGPGDLFADSINQALSACEACIALIGRRWLETDASGARRIDDSQDWVRVELAIALSRKVRVIPVLVDGAELPAKSDLPSDLAALTDHHALTLDNASWQAGIDRLVRSITKRSGMSFPILALSTEAVDFGTLRANAPSPRRSVQLVNNGVGELNASASSDLPWLLVSTRPDALDLAIDTSQVGVHTGQVMVRSEGGTATVDVTATVAVERRRPRRPRPTPPDRPPPPDKTPPERTRPDTATHHPADRTQAVARWVTLGLIAGAVLTQLLATSATSDVVHQTRPNLPDEPWPALVWLMPTPLLLVGAYLVARRRNSGLALGCVVSAGLWLLTSVVLVEASGKQLDTSSHYLALLLVTAAACALVVASPETRERAHPNVLHRMVPALVLLVPAVALRTASDRIATLLTGSDNGPTALALSASDPTLWLSALVPLAIGLPAALVVWNTAQTRTLVTIAWLQVLYPAVLRPLIFDGAVQHHDGDAGFVLVNDLTFIAGNVCLLLAVLVGQRRSTEVGS